MKNKQDQTQKTQGFNMENRSNVEGKKSRALASKSSLYRVCVFHNAKRRLTRGLINEEQPQIGI